MMSHGRRLWMLCLPWGVVACGNGDTATFSRCAQDSSVPAAESRDSDESIVLTNCHAAFEESGWVVDPTPDLELGDEVGPDSSFERIQAVRSLPDRGVAVLDQGSHDLRFFDESGELVRRLGGQGAGPGEFELPHLLPTPGSHSLVVFDRRLQRLTTYSVTGELESVTSTAHEPWLSRVSAPSGLVGSRRLIEFMPTDGIMVSTPGINEKTRTILWVDADTGEEHRIGQYVVFPSHTAADGFNVLDVPFAPRVNVVATETGVLVTEGQRFEIRELDVSARLVRVLRVEAARDRVRPEDLTRYVDRRARRGFTGVWLDFSEVPVPDSMPAFGTLRVDEMGWIWAELSGWATTIDQPSDWMVFAPDGRARGLVRMPAGLSPHEIAEDYVLGVWEDELGVPHVRRHALHR
jgi:hypothetical protein